MNIIHDMMTDSLEQTQPLPTLMTGRDIDPLEATQELPRCSICGLPRVVCEALT